MKTEIEVKSVRGHYEIYVHGEFFCSCESDELSEVIRKIEKNLKYQKQEQ